LPQAHPDPQFVLLRIGYSERAGTLYHLKTYFYGSVIRGSVTRIETRTAIEGFGKTRLHALTPELSCNLASP
jgi:hypothetical protein